MLVVKTGNSLTNEGFLTLLVIAQIAEEKVPMKLNYLLSLLSEEGRAITGMEANKFYLCETSSRMIDGVSIPSWSVIREVENETTAFDNAMKYGQSFGYVKIAFEEADKSLQSQTATAVKSREQRTLRASAKGVPVQSGNSQAIPLAASLSKAKILKMLEEANLSPVSDEIGELRKQLAEEGLATA